MFVQSIYPIPMQYQFPMQKLKTPQSIRDNEKVEKRVKRIGDKLNHVSNFIDNYFGTHVTIAILTSLAKIVMGMHKVKLDRLARRNRKALLCWYAENWDVIQPILKDRSFKDRFKVNLGQTSNGIIGDKIEKNQYPASESFMDPTDLTVLLNFH